MIVRKARMLVLLLLVALPLQARSQTTDPKARTVFFAGRLSPIETAVVGSALEASGHPGVLLLDSWKSTPYFREFLTAFRTEAFVPMQMNADDAAGLERRFKIKPSEPLTWHGPHPGPLWKQLFPRADSVVVCPASPRGQLLQAAWFAGLRRAPLFVLTGEPGEKEELQRWLKEWKTKRVVFVGESCELAREIDMVESSWLADGQAINKAALVLLTRDGPVNTLVVANPADQSEPFGGMSALAPWLALQRRAALLLTRPEGDNVEQVVAEALQHRQLHEAENVLLVGGLEAIPMQRRPNPITTDKDPFIEMEPLTPTGSEPFSFAVGRLFNQEPAIVTLQVARHRLLAEATGPRRALVASNPGSSLPFLEVFSRNTAKELANAGYRTTGLFGRDVTRDELRRLMPGNDVIVWEGHHNTLIKEWAMPEWDEPLPPSFVLLQSCLALMEPKAQPLVQRGAVAVVGTSTRTYSASGGAFTLAFMDSLLYEQQSLGGSLRQAKNFLLAYMMLKEKRLGEDAKRGGANQRAMWAFTLWGDPTLTLPRPQRPEATLPAVEHRVQGNAIVLNLPEKAHEKVVLGRFQVELPPNARLAGLLRKEADDDGQPLVPFVFAEVQLPKAPAGKTPTLKSRLPSSHYVFCWDERRKTGYLLVTPRAKDENELRFSVHWEEAESAITRAQAESAQPRGSDDPHEKVP